MKGIQLLVLACFILPAYVYAQKGNNQLQISAQASRPTSEMLVLTNFGYGGAVKGMYGFGEQSQVTLEGGYNWFPVKHVPSGIQVHYSAIPVYGGYRCLINNFTLEAQVGVSTDRVVGRNNQLALHETRTNLGWALGVGHTYKGLEIGARYQTSDSKGIEDDLTFLGLRIAYNISL